MNKVLLGILILSMIGFFGNVDASSSSIDVVNFTIHPYNESLENNSFDGFVSGLKVMSRGEKNIVWVWKNSEEDNFYYNLVFLDNILLMNGTDEVFEARNLRENKCYEISIVSVGGDGVEGPIVVDVACTINNKGEKKSRKDVMKDDVIPNFFVSKTGVDVKNVSIVLNSSSVKERDYDWMVLLCWILGLLIFILLVLLFIFSRK